MTSHGQSTVKPSLLVTVGSTLFPKLTDSILSAPILDILAERISTLKVQHGSAPPPAHLRSTVRNLDGSRGSYKGMNLELMDYTTDFEGLVNTSDLVISHAGSGSILTTLRAGKPLLVVPNTDLMDNHQGQLASELEKGGYLVVSDIPLLAENLKDFIDDRGKGIKAFPDREPSRFKGILDEMMGFEEDRL